MRADFFDTNIILSLLDDGPKAEIAESLLAEGGMVSVQVLNEALVNCIRKARMSWHEAGDFLAGIRQLCQTTDLTAEIHDIPFPAVLNPKKPPIRPKRHSSNSIATLRRILTVTLARR
ncbi:hypothetical protein SAMN04487972_102352 [Paracoccus halophilus]|uniref:PIN domain-containing protein n=1 Tax=Paracoccus halophilus TaxID=376733 RepID=A0A1I0ST81_9RHOB|nr:hypothetical protein [Paracoccus halophilus]SFA42730.1 hypothetical protein SAMN04487972_102352 [Paracoccus halophilus]